MKKNTFAKLVVSTIAGLIFYAMMGDLKENPSKRSSPYREEAAEPMRPTVTYRTLYRRDKTYGDAVESISDSDMFSSDKRMAIETLLTDQDDDYYRGVIGITESDMFSSDKLLAIQKLTRYHTETENDESR